jgi:peptidoglycan biosynthesis protein MviN/MurJ (putative lipid II flippase)
MITSIIQFLNDYGLQLPLNLIAHSIIFTGTFYVALHNRNLKHWHITPLWYVGLASLFTAITILLQYMIGPEFPLSYWNLSLFTETLSNLALAGIAGVMFIGTVRSDLKGRRKRLEMQKEQQE